MVNMSCGRILFARLLATASLSLLCCVSFASPSAASSSAPSPLPASYPFRNSSLPLEQRISNLLSLLTVDEKIALMHDGLMYSPPLPRLSIPRYEWGQECLRGARNDVDGSSFSAFPQSIGLAASWNVSVFDSMGRVVSDEMRGQRNAYHMAGRLDGKTYLNCWAPIANLIKDSRWGRAPEAYSESTLLIYEYTSHYLAALHGDDIRHIKIAPTVKHYTVYDGPEVGRFSFNALVSARDMHDTFTAVWRRLMQEEPSHIRGVMASYSALNGVPVACDFDLLTKQPRYDWGWTTAAVVGDCGAVEGVSDSHHYAPDMAHGAALALVAGVDMDCGDGFDSLHHALNLSLINEADLDVALRHSMEVQFRVGFYDAWGDGPFDSISPSVVDSEAHRKAVLDVAEQSMVLLQNNRSVLPLDASRLKRIAVVGPSAFDEAEWRNCINSTVQCLLSHIYYAVNLNLTHPLVGIRDWLQQHRHGDVQLTYARGCERTGNDTSGFEEAVSAAKGSDVVVYVGGLDYTIEAEGFDRVTLELPAVQQQLLQALHATSVPVVAVVLHGGAISDEILVSTSSAILSAGYPSQAGGTAMANILFGSHNPCGRLPYTSYADLSQLPDIGSFAMAALPGRTYQFFTGVPRYYFGHGLSYTTFAYSDLTLLVASDGSIAGQVTVANVGPRDGAETVQVYAAYDEKFAGLDVDAELSVPRRVLVAFDKRHIAAGQAVNVSLAFSVQRLTAFGRWLQPSPPAIIAAAEAPNRRVSLSTAEVRADIARMRARRAQLEARAASRKHSRLEAVLLAPTITLPVWFAVGGMHPTRERIAAGQVLVQGLNVTAPVDDLANEADRGPHDGAAVES